MTDGYPWTTFYTRRDHRHWHTSQDDLDHSRTRKLRWCNHQGWETEMASRCLLNVVETWRRCGCARPLVASDPLKTLKTLPSGTPEDISSHLSKESQWWMPDVLSRDKATYKEFYRIRLMIGLRSSPWIYLMYSAVSERTVHLRNPKLHLWS